MTRKLKPEERKPRRPTMPAINVRMPPEFVTWLNLRAAEDSTTVAQIVRDAVGAAILRDGRAEELGIEVRSEDEIIHWPDVRDPFFTSTRHKGDA